MHVDGEILRDGVPQKGNKLLRQPAEDDADVGRRIDGRQSENGRRKRDHRCAHGLSEKSLLARHVAQQCCRRHAQFSGDIREGGGLEAFGGEDAPSAIEHFLPGDPRRTAHL